MTANVELRLDVHDIANSSTPLGTLSEAYGRAMLADLYGRGGCRFAVDLETSADIGLLEPRRVVRWLVRQDGGSWDTVEAFIIDDRPTVLADPDGRPAMAVSGQGLLGWLGYDRGGALLYPARGIEGRQHNPREFGWQTFDYQPDGAWIAPFTHGTQAAPEVVTLEGFPEGWPDPQAQWIWGTELDGQDRHDAGTNFLRGIWHTDFEGEAIVWWTADNAGELWIDGGAEGSTRQDNRYAWRDVVRQEIDVIGQDVLFAAKVVNDPPTTGANPGGLLLAVTAVTEDGEPGPVLFRSDTANWLALPYPAEVPGLNAGQIFGTAYVEAQLRGEILHVDRDWDDVEDSDEVAWGREISHGFRWQTLGRMLDDLAGLVPLEARMTPQGLLRLHQHRGQDRTAEVTVTLPFGASVSRDGPRLTRGLYETPGGAGEFGAVNEATYGVMADLLTFGSGLGPDELAAALADHLDRYATEREEVDVELPDDVRPYVDVELGDTVTVDVGGVTGSFRLTTFELADDSQTEQPEWSASGIPDG